MQSGCDGLHLEGDMLGVKTTENGHQEETRLEGNHESEIEDPSEVRIARVELFQTKQTK